MPKKISKEKQNQLNKDNLYRMYCIEYMTIQNIADIIGVSLGTVRRNLIINNIPIRDKKIRLKPNMKFGFLTTLNLIECNKEGTEIWRCICECGNYCNAKSTYLISGHTKSCGCKKCDGHNNFKHGMSKSRIYGIYHKMISRCTNEKDNAYIYYGKRGIGVCNEWMAKDGFNSFYNWAINNGYKDYLTIDRIDVNGNYTPDNCRWVDMKIQGNNKTNNHTIEYDNNLYTISELADKYDIPYDRLQSRIMNGWNIKRAIETPKMINQYK